MRCPFSVGRHEGTDVPWLGPQPATIALDQFRADCGIRHRTSQRPLFFGQRRGPASARLHTAQVMAGFPGPPHPKESPVIGPGPEEAWQQAIPSSGSRFLDTSLLAPRKEKKKEIQVDGRLADYAFFLSRVGSTLNGSSSTGCQNEGIEQEAWGGRT